jgi:2-dehydropantoate 2-reductase
MRIGIIGAGAIGMLLTCAYVRGGSDVTLIARTSAQAERIQVSGITCDGLVYRPAHCCAWEKLIDETDSMGAVDVLLLAMKNYQITEEWLLTLRNLFTENPSIPMLFIQNGIGHLNVVRAVFPDHSIWSAVTAEAVWKEDDTTVHHTGAGGTKIGTQGKFLETERVMHQLCDIWEKSGLQIERVPTIESFIWRKWIYNCVINPLTAVERVRNGVLLEEAYQVRTRKLLAEAVEVARAACKDFLWSNDVLLEGFEHICEQTANNRSSMLRDVECGRETEWMSLNGELIRLAERHRLNVPEHRRLVAQLIGKEYITDGVFE